MRRLALLLVLVGAHAAAQAPAREAGRGIAGAAQVAVTLPGADTLAVEPGGTVGFGVRLDGLDGTDRQLTVAAATPEGWAAVVPGGAIALVGGARALQIVSLRVPLSARSGVYAVAVEVQSADGWSGRYVRKVRVGARPQVSLDIVGAPRFVMAGERYGATLVVTNGGNVPAQVALSVRSVLGSAVDPAASSVEVAPGASAQVRLSVQTGPAPVATTDRLRITAVVAGAPDMVPQAASAVQIVPRPADRVRDDLWPLTASVSALGSDGGLAPSVGASGALALDPGGRHRVALHADGFGGAAPSPFAGAPEAWVRYDGPGAAAVVGTGSYVVSPATTSSSYGLGAQVAATAGALDIAALARRPSPFQEILGGAPARGGTDVGLSLGWSPRAWGRVSLNALSAWGDEPGHMATVRVEAASAPGRLAASVDAEGGAARDGRRPVYAVESRLALGPFEVVGAARHRDARQPGRSTALTTQSLSGRLGLAPGTSAQGTWRSARVADGRVEAPSAEQVGTAGVHWARSWGGLDVTAQAGGQHRGTQRLETPGVAAVDRSVTMAHGRLGGSWRGVRASLDAGRGRAWGADGRDEWPAWTASADLGLSGRAASLSGYLRASQGTSVWEARPSREWAGGVEGAWAPSAGVRLAGGLSTGRFQRAAADVAADDDDLSPGSLLLRSLTGTAHLDATVRLPGGQEVGAGVYLYQSDAGTDRHVRATLRVPIGVPLPYRVERPQVTGRLVDDSTGVGIGGVLVLLGAERAVSGADGTFRLPAPLGGGHLFVDRATLGAGRVPSQALPLAVEPGETVRIGVVRCAALRGSLRRMTVLATGTRSDTVDAAGVAHAVIEAEGMGQRYRATTDRDGRFAFEDLGVGTYTLRLVRASLPERHRPEHETLEVAVTGQTETLWRVLPEHRAMQALPGGSLRLSAAQPRASAQPNAGG